MTEVKHPITSLDTHIRGLQALVEHNETHATENTIQMAFAELQNPVGFTRPCVIIDCS